MSLRKKLIIAAAAVVVLTMGAYSTLAYLTAEETAHNVITTGNVSIELLDKTVQEGQSASSFDEVYELDNFTSVYPQGMPIMPGAKASKVVAVRKSDGSAPCWVRVRLGQDLKDGEGNSVMAGIVEEGDIEFALNEEDWVESDGWYYYKEILTDANNQTRPLLTQVNFSGPGIENEYIGTTYSIDVYAQAVQSANNAPESGVLGVRGWPQEA